MRKKKRGSFPCKCKVLPLFDISGSVDGLATSSRKVFATLRSVQNSHRIYWHHYNKSAIIFVKQFIVVTQERKTEDAEDCNNRKKFYRAR